MKEIFFDKKTITLLSLIVFLFVAMMILAPHQTLDTRLHYSGAEGREVLDSLTSAERQAYFHTEILDLAFIFSYTALFLIVFAKLFPRNLFFLYLAIVPGFCDLTETSILLYALRYREPLYAFDWLGIFTFVKWVLGLGVAILLTGLSWKRFRKVSRA